MQECSLIGGRAMRCGGARSFSSRPSSEVRDAALLRRLGKQSSRNSSDSLLIEKRGKFHAEDDRRCDSHGSLGGRNCVHNEEGRVDRTKLQKPLGCADPRRQPCQRKRYGAKERRGRGPGFVRGTNASPERNGARRMEADAMYAWIRGMGHLRDVTRRAVRASWHTGEARLQLFPSRSERSSEPGEQSFWSKGAPSSPSRSAETRSLGRLGMRSAAAGGASDEPSGIFRGGKEWAKSCAPPLSGARHDSPLRTNKAKGSRNRMREMPSTSESTVGEITAAPRLKRRSRSSGIPRIRRRWASSHGSTRGDCLQCSGFRRSEMIRLWKYRVPPP